MQWIGFLFATLGALSAALFFIPYKQAVQSVAPEIFVMAMYLLSAGFSSIGLQFNQQKLRLNRVTCWAALGFAFLSVFGNYAVGRSLSLLDPAITVVVLRSQILLIIFLSWIFLKEALNQFFWIGALVALSGFLYMNNLGQKQLYADTSGIFWALIAAFCFSLSQILMKRVIRQVQPLTINLLRLLLGFSMMALIPGSLQALLEMTATQWGLALLAAFFGPFASRTFQLYSFKVIPISQAVLLSMLTPIFTGLITWYLYQTSPTQTQLIGSSIILAGIALPLSYLCLQNFGLSRLERAR